MKVNEGKTKIMIGDSSRGVISGTSLRATSLRRMWFRSGGQLLCACSFFLFNRLSTRWRLVQYTKLQWQCLIMQAYNTAISSDFWGHEPTFTLDSHLVIGWLQNTTVGGACSRTLWQCSSLIYHNNLNILYDFCLK